MARAASLILAGGVAALVVGSGCEVPQPQLIVAIDTDLVLPGQLETDDSFASAASFDRLTIEMLTPDGTRVGVTKDRSLTVDSSVERTITITPATSWPVTFGIRATEEGVRDVRMRIRAYRADSVRRLGASRTPAADLTIDRLVTMTVPTDGVETLRVVLAGDCLGIESEPETSFQTCITAPDDMRDASAGVERVIGALPPTIAGTWPRARRTPCTAAPPSADAPCVPGGTFTRGDERFEESVAEYVSSLPRHLVHLRPFFLDRRELTVRRFRAIAARSLGPADLPLARSSTAPLCTWSPEPMGLEDRPLNCVTQALATAVCNAEGGALPTDAQWEHAARGRGGAYVWGAADATCCAAHIGAGLGCKTDGGPSDVGTFVNAAGCNGKADVSVDGVFDLTGNVRELVQDSWVFYGTSECPRRGVANDPVCVVSRVGELARGGSFRSTFDQARIGARSRAGISDDVGFRCAYPGAE